MSEAAALGALTVRLNTGTAIPQLGLGVWQTGRGTQTSEAVISALRAGYRHIDTAAVYGNEADVGLGIRKSGLPREQIFVTTKLWNADHGHRKALAAFDASLARLELDYVDLYLIHWPVPKLRLESWRALEELHEQGRARAIGVSNFMRPHLEELLSHARVPPAANQIELSPFLQRNGTVTYCRERGIAVEAYSPLTHGRRLDHPTLARVAASIGRSPAQVLIRWSLQKGFIVLPKSKRPERILENAAVLDFSLSDDQIAMLDALEEGLVTGWDPSGEP